MARTLNSSGSSNAAARIAAGDTTDAPWSFSAADGDKLLGADGSDWAEFARWHLGRNGDQSAQTKAGYSYPFGKGGQVYLAALRNIAARASAQGDDAIGARASALLEKAQKSTSTTEMEGRFFHRAYSRLDVKSMDENARIIRGIATTPTPDRIGDSIDPLGAQFRNPLPCLWQHWADAPIGLVEFQPATRSGIRFEAKLPQVMEPGTLRDRVEEAWQSVKYGLVAGASIGFRPLKDGYERMDDGGLHFKSIEIMELSIVTIPANADCTISLIKSLDRAGGAARPTPPSSSAAGPDGTRHSVRLIV